MLFLSVALKKGGGIVRYPIWKKWATAMSKKTGTYDAWVWHGITQAHGYEIWCKWADVKEKML